MHDASTHPCTQNHVPLLDLVARRLADRFGRQVSREEGRCVVRPLALPRDIEVRVTACVPFAVVEVRALVTGDLNWDAPGLHDVLLRENEALAFGTFARDGDALVVIHGLPAAAASAAALEQVVATTAQTLVDAVLLLAGLGALRH
jgi:hypothetical protein